VGRARVERNGPGRLAGDLRCDLTTILYDALSLVPRRAASLHEFVADPLDLERMTIFVECFTVGRFRSSRVSGQGNDLSSPLVWALGFGNFAAPLRLGGRLFHHPSPAQPPQVPRDAPWRDGALVPAGSIAITRGGSGSISGLLPRPTLLIVLVACDCSRFPSKGWGGRCGHGGQRIAPRARGARRS